MFNKDYIQDSEGLLRSYKGCFLEILNQIRYGAPSQNAASKWLILSCSKKLGGAQEESNR